ncbi:MAG TPA: TIGR01777 family oxidoreductase [Stellaceae bacterium]|nr:TIGR01777 family oxidoreductase [Stellaceae bacterium]
MRSPSASPGDAAPPRSFASTARAISSTPCSFLALAWSEWHGPLALLLVLVMAGELMLTLAAFVIEDRTRDLPPSERVTHTLLAVNFGVVLGAFAPQLVHWSALPAGFTWREHGLLSWIASAFGGGVLLWGGRDLARARTLERTETIAAPAVAGVLPGRLAILITGGTGFIGTRLAEVLAEAGHRVTVLTRDPRKGRKFLGRVTLIDNLATLGRDTPFDAIVNLAGAPVVGGRWTAKRRQLLLESCLATTRAVVKLIERSRRKPAVLVSGSAVGFYGSDADQSFTEVSTAKPDFTHELCAAWEAEALAAQRSGVRVCCLRTGIVLGADGGALAPMLLPFELGLGGRIGQGRQWMSWIHRDDIVGLIIHAIAVDSVDGVINGTAPEPVRNVDFARALGRALHRPALLPVPAFALRLALGQLAEEVLLGGQRVLPQKAIETGYQFLYPTLEEALGEICGRHRSGS